VCLPAAFKKREPPSNEKTGCTVTLTPSGCTVHRHVHSTVANLHFADIWDRLRVNNGLVSRNTRLVNCPNMYSRLMFQIVLELCYEHAFSGHRAKRGYKLFFVRARAMRPARVQNPVSRRV
jgi:hypothetical protein